MAQHCAHCNGTDLLAGLSYQQCLTCGQLTDFAGEKAEFGLDAEGKRLALEGVNDTADYAAAQRAAAVTVEEPAKKGKKNG